MKQMNFHCKRRRKECLDDDIFVFLSKHLSLRCMLEDILLLDLVWNRKLLLIVSQILAYLHHNMEYHFTFRFAVPGPLSDCIFILNYKQKFYVTST